MTGVRGVDLAVTDEGSGAPALCWGHGFGSCVANEQHFMFDWARDVIPWLDFNYAQGNLFNGSMTGEQWAQLGTTSLIWLIVPLTIGLWSVLRSEVK